MITLLRVRMFIRPTCSSIWPLLHKEHEIMDNSSKLKYEAHQKLIDTIENHAYCAFNYWASHNPSGSLLTQVFSEKVFALELGTNPSELFRSIVLSRKLFKVAIFPEL